ncbi:MAG: gliding motility lipoprotein GldH [Oceanihabitans sp.]
MRNRSFSFLFFLAFILISCDANGVFDTYQSVSNTWHKDAQVHFNIKEIDTSKTYNLFVNLRNNNKFKYSNIHLIVTLDYPNGKTIKDTLEYKMTKPNGAFLGTGFSSIKENKLWYKENFRFNEYGEYQLHIQHAMRKNGEVNGIIELEGITDVGFRIENTNK